MKISVCIPMYNENKVIVKTAETLSDYMRKNFEDYEIIFCNDGSTDGCEQTVIDLKLPCVKVIGYEQNRGKGFAIRTAMLEATGDVRLFTDADLAYGTDVIREIFDIFNQQKDIDVIIGSRTLHKEGYSEYTLLRKVFSKTYIKVLCLAGGFRLSDSQCGCKAYSGEAAQKIFSRCEVNGFAFDFETILWATKLKMKIYEHPVKIIHHGESKVHVFKDTFVMLKDLRKMKKRIFQNKDSG